MYENAWNYNMFWSFGYMLFVVCSRAEKDTSTSSVGIDAKVKPELCLVSNVSDLSRPFAVAVPLIVDGCPMRDVRLDGLRLSFDVGLIYKLWHKESSGFLHCAVRTCLVGNSAKCEQSRCRSSRRRGRRCTLRGSLLTNQTNLVNALNSFDTQPTFQIRLTTVKLNRGRRNADDHAERTVADIGYRSEQPASKSDAYLVVSQTLLFICMIAIGITIIITSITAVLVILLLRQISSSSSSE